jgi:acyl-CoA hydrolase/RimJ/RimL family protein N-acetyltransferase
MPRRRGCGRGGAHLALSLAELRMQDPNWQDRYRTRVLSPREAIAKLEPGRRILVGSGAAEPLTLVNALAEYGDHLADNEIVHLLTLGPAPYVRPEFERRFRHAAFFIGPNTRAAVQEGRADFIPVFLSELPRLIQSRRIRVDAVLLQVTPPDRHGQVSLGVSVDVVRAAVDSAELVIAEVNPAMPRTFGDSLVRVEDIDWLVPVNTAVPELPLEPLDETSLAIGKHVASLIPDGATLQTGIGKIPHAIVKALGNRHDLGVHTEMLSDSIVDLVEAGVVTGRRKTLLPGKIVTSFVMGTKRLYDWVDDNPLVELRPSDFTNDPLVVARNDNMVAINSALAVDLTGQVAADTIGGRFFSGIGGQVDFIRGAARSRGGRPIIALPSTAKDGSLSRIQPAFEEGAGVVTSRGDVHYVVTEYGVADLWGRSIRERALALIEVAHPDFRAELLGVAKNKRYVFADQRVPRVTPRYSAVPSAMKDGERVRIRPIRMADQEVLQDLFYRLSDESTYQRFLGFKKCHPREEIMALADVESKQSMALVAEVEGSDTGELVGMARYDLDEATGFADVAVVVTDRLQNKGLGKALFARLVEIAKAEGIAGFTADVLPDNGVMLAIFQKSGERMESRLDRGLYRVRLTFE